MEKDQAIFLSILEDHKGIIFKVMNAYCQDAEDRKDLTQEIIVQLWISLERYDPQFKLSTWIYRVALNTSISYYRKSKSLSDKTSELPTILESTLKDKNTSPDNKDMVLLERFISELKEFDKALILLYLDELSQKEIAEIIGMSQTNVSTKIGRIKDALRKKFEKVKSKNHAG